MSGYQRALEWNERPTAAERRYLHWAVACADGAPARCWIPLARIGDVSLYLAPPGQAQAAPARFVEPVVAVKAGRRGTPAVGVDGSVCLSTFEDGPPASDPPSLPSWQALGATLAATGGDPVTPRVAIIDVGFDNVGALRTSAAYHGEIDGPQQVGLPTGSGAPPLGAAPGHGTAMAGIILHQVPGARVGLFQIPGVAGAVPPYLAPTSLAVAVAAAVALWRADVVLIAMSDGAWGTPRHLREVLRAAGRGGRGGKGAALFCSVGDPSRNHPRDADSAVLGADDLASQPWVQAIAACDRDGRWYRTYAEYRAGRGAVYNRLGPAVTLAAPGEARRFGDRIAADDSSQAAALAAAAAAAVLRDNPGLTVDELRALLALTADVPAIVDGGAGLAAGQFDVRDRMGHCFKLGYGVVNAQAACLAARDPLCLALLATREVPDPAPGDPSLALRLAAAWDHAVGGAADERDNGGLAAAYARVHARLAPLWFHALPVQEALGWLARHLRALVADVDPAWPQQDHGALLTRIQHAVEALRDAAAPRDAALAAWLAQTEYMIGRMDSAYLSRSLVLLLATCDAPVRRALGLGEPTQRGRCGPEGLGGNDVQRGET